MEKAMALLQKISFFRPKEAGPAGDAAFELRMKKINRARQVGNGRGDVFRNRPSQSKA